MGNKGFQNHFDVSLENEVCSKLNFKNQDCKQQLTLGMNWPRTLFSKYHIVLKMEKKKF